VKTEEDWQEGRITGMLVAYHQLCERKAWLFANGIRPETENSLVQARAALHRHAFRRKIKEIKLEDQGVVDILQIRRHEIHEIKKSSLRPDVDGIQAAFYLHWLNQRGVDIRQAVLKYPLEKKTIEITWSEDLKNRVEEALKAIHCLIKRDEPPKAIKKSACYKCAYKDFCFE
jgi:CRISPR-associated exonuclease Cas4